MFGKTKMTNNAYCALGLLACRGGMIKTESDFDNIGESQIRMKFGLTYGDVAHKCPARDGFGDRDIIGLIIHLNDGHRWSFKQIGEWLKSIGK